MTYLPNIDIQASRSPSTDAFGRWRVSNPATLYSCTHTYDLNPLMWESHIVGGATIAHSGSRSGVTLTVNSPGDLAIRQTYDYWQYQPGKSHYAKFTFVMGPHLAGTRCAVGYYDDSDGVFLERGADGIAYIVLRSSVSGAPVDIRIAQSNWNVDKLDGTGISGETLDLTKAQILLIDLQYLGVGSVRVGLDILGKCVDAHEFHNANLIGSVYMSTGSLPLRYEVEDVSSVAAGAYMEQICSEISAEGGWDIDIGLPFSADTGVTPAAMLNGVERSIITIRPRLLFGAKPNRGLLIPAAVEIYNVGANPVLWTTHFYSTSAAAVFADVDATNSIGQSSVSQVAVAGGIKTGSGYLAPSAGVFRGSPYTAEIRNRLYLSLDMAAASQREFCLAGTGVGGASSVYAAVVWAELR